MARIFTFGYNANFRAAGNVSTSVLDFAKDLLFDLNYGKDDHGENLRIGNVSRSVKARIFNTSNTLIRSFIQSELTIPKAYMQGQNDPEYEAIIKAISGIAFLATPHRGTNLAELLDRILRSSVFTSSKRYISELGKNSFTLQKLNEQFRHIAPSKPDLLQKMLQLKEDAIDFGTADPRTIWGRIFKPIIFRMQGYEPVYWIIDGLDEADDPRAVIKLLSEISTSSAPIRVLVVSRKTSEILSGLQKVPDELQLQSLSIEGHEEDFSHFVRQELNVFGDANFKESIVKQIVRGAQNNFLVGVPRTYIFSESQTDSLLSQALYEGTTQLLNFQRSIVDLCGGFIVIDNGGYVAMVHQTAREYLLNGVDRPFHIGKVAAHKQVFLSCMRRLVAIGLRAKVDGGQKPVFLDYAACFWPVHLASTSAEDAEVAEALHKFLAGRWVLTWIQVLATIEQLRVLIQASRHLARYSAKQKHFGGNISNEKQNLVKQELFKSWAEDCAKVVGKFGSILRRNPTSIHKLIPPFCPPNSAIYQQFGKMRDRSLVVSGFSSRNWDDSLARLSFGLGTYATSISAAGAQIATLIPSGSVLLHDYSTFEECSPSPIKHGERVYRMELNSSGTLLATYGYLTTKLWETRTGKCRLSVENAQSRPRPLAMLLLEKDQRLLVGSDDRLIRSLNLESNAPKWEAFAALEEPELEGHFLNSPNHMALDRDGKLVSVAYRGHPLSAWEIDGPVHIGHCWRTREVVARGEVIEAMWHPQHPEVLGLYIEGVIFRWRPYDDETEEFTAGASRLAMSGDGNLLVTGDVRGTVKVYNSADFCILYQLTSENNVIGLTFSPDLRRFYDVRGNYGNAWEPNALLKFAEQQSKDNESESEIGSLAQISTESEMILGRVDAITALAASPVGRPYCYGTEQGAAYLYDTERGKLADINTSKGFLSIEQMSWSNDGHFIGFSDSSKTVTVKTVDPTASNPDSFVQTQAKICVKTIVDGPITQLLFHPDSSHLLICSSSSVCTISLVSFSVNHSSKVSIAGSRWMIHPQDPALMIGITIHDIHVLDWNLSLHQTFRIEHSLDQPLPSSLAHQATVEKILLTHDKKHILVQISPLNHYSRERRFLYFESPSDARSTEEAASSDPENASQKVAAVELPHALSSQIVLALNFLSQDHLIYLSKDFSICSVRLQFCLGSSSASSLLQSRLDGVSSMQPDLTALLQSTDLLGSDLNALDRIKLLFWLPGDWISRDCLTLCTTSVTERSLLCPRNGEVAVVRCAAMV
ncbi:MAG: hypothetical protein LQ338_003273 [Usnochroma carphineum]|nr:MAG: hypothetical protein LQ338_003273 [Usnochroma carphineum]